MRFRNNLGENVYYTKYGKPNGDLPYDKLVELVVINTIHEKNKTLKNNIIADMQSFRFLPGGRNLYYASMSRKYTNNCFALLVDDTKEGWSELLRKVTLCLMVGGGVGINYSCISRRGRALISSGGEAGGPLSLAMAVDAVSQQIQQGGARRAAIAAIIPWNHPDVKDFIYVKSKTGVMPCTNISIIFDDMGMKCSTGIFTEVLSQALISGEPGFYFQHNGDGANITSACMETRFTRNDSACNLGSINLAEISSLEEMERVTEDATKFLLWNSITSQMPYEEARKTKEKSRTIGLGLMGIHEWLIKHGYRYHMTEELRRYMEVYRDVSRDVATREAKRLGIAIPERVRAIAPCGTLAIIAGTTGGIEPVFSHAYKRRYFYGQEKKEEFVVDAVTDRLVTQGIVSPGDIQTAYTISMEDRICFQADIQDYVDQAISSTVNINEKIDINQAYDIIKKYANRLKGLTLYPNHSRELQPLEEVDYYEAKARNASIEQEDACKNGVCSL